jgi:hypothetical protein
MTLSTLFEEKNRGLLLDLVVFVANIFLMRTITRYYLQLIHAANESDLLAQYALLIVCIGMWVLPAAGAYLKRFHFAGRRKSADFLDTTAGGCLFNPIFYFCLNLVLISAIIAGVGQMLFPKAQNNGAVFIPMIFGGLILTIIQTVIIYRYFSPPGKPPKWEFLKRTESELVGDICLFLNMILFQIAWNMLSFEDLGSPSGFTEFLGRLFFLCFLALLIYFPPRMFYLALKCPHVTALIYGKSSATCVRLYTQLYAISDTT